MAGFATPLLRHYIDVRIWIKTRPPKIGNQEKLEEKTATNPLGRIVHVSAARHKLLGTKPEIRS